MRSQGACIIAQCLRGDCIAPAILAVEEAQSDPDADHARRVVESERANAARGTMSAEQTRIANEQKERECTNRMAVLPDGNAPMQGSVWNVNAWHWEERPITNWSTFWLQREFSSLTITM